MSTHMNCWSYTAQLVSRFLVTLVLQNKILLVSHTAGHHIGYLLGQNNEIGSKVSFLLVLAWIDVVKLWYHVYKYIFSCKGLIAGGAKTR